ncbi:septation protein A [Betaproteobacteria bacterium GR16-43]|nr:septation protein A [Betaproteobacteria bacterium GR16-43]
MKFLFDFLPLVLFFVAFKVAGIFVATAVAIAVTVAQIGYLLVRRQKVSGMQWAVLVIIVVFGGATLVLQDETYIKWKPTVLYWSVAVTLLGALAFGKNFMKSMLAHIFTMPDPIWFKVCVMWGVFFIAKGALNLWVAFNFPLETWVTFKVWGSTAIFFVFAVAQIFWLSKYMVDEPEGKPH